MKRLPRTDRNVVELCDAREKIQNVRMRIRSAGYDGDRLEEAIEDIDSVIRELKEDR